MYRSVPKQSGKETSGINSNWTASSSSRARKKGLESGRLRRSPEKAFKVTSCRLSVTGWNDTKRNKATPVRCGPGYLITS